MDTVEFGIDTFGDVPRDDRGEIVSYAEAIRRVVAEAVLADEAGIDVIAVGEHHRPEFSISAPETVLAGIATRTSRIHLASGVTVLSSDDPVRVFQRFATVDALSGGRAEVILGRGSFTESFPLFGYDLATTRCCSTRSSTCSSSCSTRSRSPGRARRARPCTTPTCSRRPSRAG